MAAVVSALVALRTGHQRQRRRLLVNWCNRCASLRAAALHQSASGAALRITAAREEGAAPGLAVVAAPGLAVAAAPGLQGGRQQGQARVKSLGEMPGPSTLANLVEFFYRDGFSRIHEIQYGKIFKSHFGPQLVVSVADRDLVAQVLRAEGATPQRANMESWKEYRDMRGRSTALISA
ncbi:hypothetical protein CRUP_001047 [Coryphaenoides rupestris]|nr:hypothetical protein CRUP_001047 [Coryphaenoides rupestris]